MPRNSVASGTVAVKAIVTATMQVPQQRRRRESCLNPVCMRDAVRESGYCDPCNQAILRRIRKGTYTREDLIAKGKLLVPAIDEWLRS